METLKRIGILTSGGDCAGLNAAIRAVVHRATELLSRAMDEDLSLAEKFQLQVHLFICEFCE